MLLEEEGAVATSLELDSLLNLLIHACSRTWVVETVVAGALLILQRNIR